MSNEIFTPITLWEDFTLEHLPIVETIGEFVDGDIAVTRFYLKGRTLSDGEVKIYGAIARNKQKNKMPGIFVVQDFRDAADETLICHLAERGYAALTFDFAGDSGINGNHSVYPDSLSGINYKNCYDKLTSLKGDAKSSPWYEWGVTARYAFDYLASLPFVTKIGAIGIGEAANLVWHISATDMRLNCATFVMNAGWKAYRGMNKFKTGSVPEFSGEMLRYLACIEPQSYAAHVKCPALLLVATNSNKFDFDRAYDTLSRINPGIYSSIDYSVEARDSVCAENVKTMEIFFARYLKNSKEELPRETALDGEISNGKLLIKVTPDFENLEEVYVYVAEQAETPCLRSWKKLTECYKTESGEFCFQYQPYSGSGGVLFFARSIYKSGYSVGSNVICKKFQPEDVLLSYRSNVIYSSRIPGTESVFTPALENHVKPSGLNIFEDNTVKIKKGPMGITGVCCFGGLLSFCLGTEKYMPKEDAILMIDLYVKQDSVLTVKLITDYFENKIEYVAKVKINGANAWRNVKLERTDFKTEQGMGLKGFEKIQALIIDAEGEHLINNVLWV